MPYRFKPPSVMEGPIGNHRLFQFYEMPRGITVLKYGSEYYEVRYPQQEDVDMADKAYIGGNWHIVDDAEAADLIAAGYEVEEVS